MTEGMVSGVAIDLEKEEILLGLTLVPTKPQGCYGLPGGRIETGETPLRALKREWAEEVLKSGKAGRKIKTSGKRTEMPRTGPNGNYVHHFYNVRLPVGELKIHETAGEIGPPQWIPISKITSGEVKMFFAHLKGTILVLEKMACKSAKAAYLTKELSKYAHWDSKLENLTKAIFGV